MSISMYWNKRSLYWKIAKLFCFCHLKKLGRSENYGPTLVYTKIYIYLRVYLLKLYKRTDIWIYKYPFRLFRKNW